jgi:hypothetical protein
MIFLIICFTDSMQKAFPEEIFHTFLFFCGAKTQFGLDRHTVEVSRPHTIGHKYTQPAGLLWTSDQLVADTATYPTHSKYKGRTSTPLAGFENVIPVTEQPQTQVSDRAATGIGFHVFIVMWSVHVD